MGANTNTEQIQFLIQNCICSLPILEQIQSKYKQIHSTKQIRSTEQIHSTQQIQFLLFHPHTKANTEQIQYTTCTVHSKHTVQIYRSTRAKCRVQKTITCNNLHGSKYKHGANTVPNTELYLLRADTQANTRANTDRANTQYIYGNTRRQRNICRRCCWWRVNAANTYAISPLKCVFGAMHKC